MYLSLIVFRKNLPLLLSSFLILLGAIFIIPYGNFQEAGIVPKFWIGISIMSLGFVISQAISSINSAWFWSITILARLLLIPMEPGDDIWRYLWEGYIQNLGFSPYDLAPNATELIPYRTEWWSLINHPDTSAIYPPLSQLGFRTLALISPSVFIFKLAFVCADLGICWLLTRKFSLEKTLVYAWNPLIIYSFAGGGHYDSWFLLLLVVAWLTFFQEGRRQKAKGRSGIYREILQEGNLPLETTTNYKQNGEVFNQNRSTVRSFCFADNYRSYCSAFFVGVSVAIKWMSLPILCFVAWQKILGYREQGTGNREQKRSKITLLYNSDKQQDNIDNICGNWQFDENKVLDNREQRLRLGYTRLICHLKCNLKKIQQAGILLLIGLLPICVAALNFCASGKCSLIPTSSNFVVKGRSAEFIPYLVSLVWEQSTKYNWIYGIPLGLAVVVLIWNSHKFVNFAEWYFFLLLTLSPIVHAWYFTWLIPFAVATNNLGTRWVSLSAFIYFILKHRQALGDHNWFLTPMERYWLWLPLIIGFIWSQWQHKKNSESLKVNSELSE